MRGNIILIINKSYEDTQHVGGFVNKNYYLNKKVILRILHNASRTNMSCRT